MIRRRRLAVTLGCVVSAACTGPGPVAPTRPGEERAAAALSVVADAADVAVPGPPGGATAQNDPPNADFRTTPATQAVDGGDLARNPDLDGKIEGSSPLDVTFNMCPSTDPDEGDELRFTFDFDGDGVIDERGNCRASHTYLAQDLKRNNGCQRPEAPAEVCVSDRRDEPGHKICRQYLVCARGAEEPAPKAKTCLSSGTLSKSLTSSSPTQTGRVFRDAVTSTCAAPKGNPGLSTTTGSRPYEVLSLRNEATSATCVSATLTGSCGTNGFVVAYTAPFDPNNIGNNWLADPGFSSSSPVTFSFTVPAQTSFDVVVHQVPSGAANNCSFTLTVTDSGCS